MEALRAEIPLFTVALRDAGTTPEHALAVLKTIINNRITQDSIEAE
jgi:hypothetical protein